VLEENVQSGQKGVELDAMAASSSRLNFIGTKDMEVEEQGEPSNAVIPSDETKAEAPAPISKSQQKKLLRNQKIEEQKLVKRKYERDRRKARRLEARLAGKDLGKEKREAYARERHVVPAKVVIDCSFDEFMTEKVRIICATW
jgi:hypothetical protein